MTEHPTVTIGGTEYHLKYDVNDILQLEAWLGGLCYQLFFEDDRVSFTAAAELFYRGLRTLDARGERVYATAQSTAEGHAAAAELLHALIASGTCPNAYDLIYSAFAASGWVVPLPDTSTGDTGPLARPAPAPVPTPSPGKSERGRGRSNRPNR